MLAALAMLFSKSASNQDGVILAMQRFYTEETSNFMLVYVCATPGAEQKLIFNI